MNPEAFRNKVNSEALLPQFVTVSLATNCLPISKCARSSLTLDTLTPHAIQSSLHVTANQLFSHDVQLLAFILAPIKTRLGFHIGNNIVCM